MTVFGDPLWAELLSLANILFAGVLSIYSFRRAFYHRGFMRVMMVTNGIIGAYWAGMYIWVFLTPSGFYDGVWFGQFFVRPAFTFTMAVLASQTLYRYRTRGNCG